MTVKTYPYQQDVKSLYQTADQEPVCITREKGNNLYLITDKDIETLYFWKIQQSKTIPKENNKKFPFSFNYDFLSFIESVLKRTDIEPERKIWMIETFSIAMEKRKNPPSLEEIHKTRDEITEEAQKRGLTPEILEEILNEK